MDTLQINITIDSKESLRKRNYRYEIKVDRKIVAEGVFKGIPRIENLMEKIREFVVIPSENKGKVSEPIQTHIPLSAPIEKQQDRYLTEREVSDITGVSLSTLRSNRSSHKGMPYIKVGRSIRYKLLDVITYMDEHRIKIQGS